MRMPARSTVRACQPRFNEAVKQDMHADLTNFDLFRHIPGLSLGPEFFAFSLQVKMTQILYGTKCEVGESRT